MRYALFLLFEAERDETELSLEQLDDVTLHHDGNAVELLQVKHHVNATATLTNTSPELWKTLRIWSTLVTEKRMRPDTILTLISTATIPDKSLLYQLKPNPDRDNKYIAQELLKLSQLSRNADLASAFESFQKLSAQERESLVASIRILDGSSDISDTSEKIKKRLPVRPQHRDAVYSRLEGWWFDNVVHHLMSNDGSTITRMDLIHKYTDIIEQFKPDALPIDYFQAEPSETPDAEKDQRRFVDQLRVIGLQNRQIENAIRDYYRAFEQRSRWEREQLLQIGELRNYEQHLVDEWDRRRLWDKVDPENEGELTRIGQELFRWAEESAFYVRPQVTEPYVMRGSYHMLANEELPRVWWHPLFVERLKQIVQLPEISSNWQKRPVEVRNLFNPAYCSKLIHDAIKGYSQQAKHGMPYPLLFLVLPVILHKSTREALPRSISSKLHVWLGNTPSARVGFAQRTRDLVSITKEGLSFGIDRGHISLSIEDRFISTGKQFRKLQRPIAENLSELDVNEIERRALFVGRWFARAGSISSIYVMWGIRP